MEVFATDCRGPALQNSLEVYHGKKTVSLRYR